MVLFKRINFSVIFLSVGLKIICYNFALLLSVIRYFTLPVYSVCLML